MIVCIAGGRDFLNYELLKYKCDKIICGRQFTILSGHAKGADALGEQYAKDRGLELKIMPADWKKYGKSAGFKRNEEMSKVADALIAFWDGQSKGTKHMIDTMQKLGKPVRIIRY